MNVDIVDGVLLLRRLRLKTELPPTWFFEWGLHPKILAFAHLNGDPAGPYRISEDWESSCQYLPINHQSLLLIFSNT